VARRRFSAPSLFEKPCPHHVPAYVRATRRADLALARYDTASARRYALEALEARPGYLPALGRLARLDLAAGDARGVITLVDSLGRPPFGLALRRADALALAGDAEAATRRLDSLIAAAPFYAGETRALLALRRALYPEAAIMRIVTAIAPDSSKAARLESVAARREGISPESAAAAVWMRALWLAGSAPAEAADLLAEAPSFLAPGTSAYERGVVARQRLAWRADWLAEAGRYRDAARAYADAAAAFASAGDLHAAALRRHRAAAMLFAAGSPSLVPPPAPTPPNVFD
jgi:hypothetical protein